MSSKEDKKAEKLRLAEEKKQKKLEEKLAKKAAKESAAVQRRVSKDIKTAKRPKKASAIPSMTLSTSSSSSTEPTDSRRESMHSRATVSEESETDSRRGIEDVPKAPFETPTQQPVLYEDALAENPLLDNGVGMVAQALFTGDEEEAPQTVLSSDDLDLDGPVNMGEGVFGMVFECKILSMGVKDVRDGDPSDNSEWVKVVVKKLQRGASVENRALFVKEAAVMEKVEHPNLLRAYGSILSDNTNMIVFESHGIGNLKTYLENSRKASLSFFDQVNMIQDVATGLEYLHEKNVVHKDMAARNCLVTVNNRVRIGDFGLSKTRFPNDYHPLPTKCSGTLPLRWMAPESLESLEFSQASDVWSFGITVWEIISHGNQPYSLLSTSEIVAHVLEGGKVKLKRDTNQSLIEIFDTIVSTEASARPAMSTVVSTISSLVNNETKRVEALKDWPSATEVLKTAESNVVPNNAYHDPDDAKESEEPYDELKKVKNKFKKGTKLVSKKSYRSLGRFKEAENPEEEFDDFANQNCPELNAENLTITEELGQGAFGIVVKGKYTKPNGDVVNCACKTLKEDTNAESLDSLVAEAQLVASFDHPNVIACFGQVTKSAPAMIVFEFMSNGSLLGYLEEAPELPRLQRLMQMAIDVAKGMSHLEKRCFIHRDLAARNILVDEELHCKISDFGLSRDLDDDTYYQSEGGMVPIRWTPPEAYKYKKYSTSSDVWSYGIALYEIWTKGALPYGKSWTNMNVMLKVEEGYRLPPPAGCPKAVYQLMVQCWNPRRLLRPSFDSISARLDMAYDMLFPAEEEVEVIAALPEEDYGNLDQMYMGVEVPTEADLDSVEDNYLVNPAPAPVIIEPPKKREQAYHSPGMKVATKPDRFSMLGTPTNSSDYKSSTLGSMGMADIKEEKSPNRVNSLRRQRQLSGDDGSEVTKIEYTHTAKVTEMLKLSREKEHRSAVEEIGIGNVLREGLEVEVDNAAYTESVGRAVEENPEYRRGKVKCTCRRFKCVCGAK
eukprot:m.25202 g.25202  ORF g.25202 m.25202 type:complete len:1008 (+) comp14914_c0_seq1:265-3288(+)